jgi:hypothetical protein
MFGYIRPLKAELKVREFEEFKACYCALCHTLKAQYGVFSRFVLNYDFTFLTMLLWEDGDTPSHKCGRCMASPFKKRTFCAPSRALELSAGYSVILAWWKLRDSVADESFLKSLRDRFFSLLLKKAYKKATKTYPDFEKTVRTGLDELRKLESSGSDSLDACADKFAVITAALSSDAAGPGKQRPLQQLLYHMGRFIYIIDACGDLESDLKSGSFNAVARRYGNASGKLSDSERESLKTTLLHSCNLLGAAYELLKQNPWSEIIKNIVYLGMPEACTRVLNGTWRAKDNSRLNKGNGQTL